MKIVLRHILLFFAIIGMVLLAVAQQPKQHSNWQKNWSLNGYVSNMQSFLFRDISEDWVNDNLIHNRLKLRWTDTAQKWSFGMDLRTRLLSGETVESVPGYADMIKAENGVLNLSHNIFQGSSFVLNSMVDRLYLDYQKGQWQITIGRQRINWGQTFAWNPNDIFNAYSFFDFDYIEKPGSDALRVQYYRKASSSLELATKIDDKQKMTAAVLYKWNKWKYDMQVLAGIVDQNDWMIGAGWSGNIKKASFRGEMSYFEPKNAWMKGDGICVLTLGTEYVFKNSLMIMGEALYNKIPKGYIHQGFSSLYNIDFSAKKLSFSEYALMTQLSYPINPITGILLAGMYYPDINGYYIGPTFTRSLSDDIELGIITQLFGGDFGSIGYQHYYFAFIKLKLNF